MILGAKKEREEVENLKRQRIDLIAALEEFKKAYGELEEKYHKIHKPGES
jgi:hypothetical protein